MPIAILEKEIRTLPAETKDIDISKRFGALPELSPVPNDIDFCNDEIAAMFGV